MITIKIDKKYNLPTSYDEITIAKAEKLFNIPIPPLLLEFYKAQIKGNSDEVIARITNEDFIVTFPTYYGAFLAELANIPIEIMNKVQSADRIAFYKQYCLEFVLGLHIWPNYTPKGLEYIQCGDERLYLPITKTVMGVEVPLYDTSAIEFAEAVDIQNLHDKVSEGKYTMLANLTTSLCKPKGETYDQDKAIDRAELLKDMPLSDALEVFFCSIDVLIMQLKQNQSSLQEVLEMYEKNLWRRAYHRGAVLLSTWAKLQK